MSSDSDRALLQQFEPVIRYTRGEQFFPSDVERYVKTCSLWMQPPDEDPVCLIPEGQLTLEKLSEQITGSFGTIYYLQFIEPLNITQMASYALQESLRKKDPNEVFHAGRGRLSRVGYTSRVVDALFSLTLFARGRIPGATAAAAIRTYRGMLAEQEQYCYYGRVVRQNNWIALQYWFFYFFNGWRSGFHGVNDHEADWEMVYVYLSETDAGEVKPEWVAYASHDFSGDDLRRRWDDPELTLIGDHPVIYSGAGSHASYYAPGEYLAEVELPFLAPFVHLVDEVEHIWRRRLGGKQATVETKEHPPTFNIFRVPFVDYARGDGISIGPGGDKTWDEPRLLDPLPAWAKEYRGLWGLYAHDPISGENAPAGPLYDRYGMVRRSWYDPLGWAGLDKVPPPGHALEVIQVECKEIEERCANLETSISVKSRELVTLGLQCEAMLDRPYLKNLYSDYLKNINILSDEVKRQRVQYAADSALLEALHSHADQLQQGKRAPLRAHIRHATHPTSDAGIRLGRFAETWSAISIGLMILGFVGIVLFARHYLLLGLVGLVSTIVFVEASFRRQLTKLVNSITIGLTGLATIVLVYNYFWPIIIAGVIVAGSYIMWENIKELRA